MKGTCGRCGKPLVGRFIVQAGGLLGQSKTLCEECAKNEPPPEHAGPKKPWGNALNRKATSIQTVARKMIEIGIFIA